MLRLTRSSAKRGSCRRRTAVHALVLLVLDGGIRYVGGLPALACAALLATAAPLAAALPEVTLGRVLDAGAGGSFTTAMTAELDGHRVFVKSRRGSARGTRYANLESDVLAATLFTRLGVHAPGARIVRLSPRSTCRELGDVVQLMEFVDARFAGGKLCQGFWPTSELADTDAYIKIALADILMGNADRRDANFFTALSGKRHVPIPIDNNAGFGTMIPWFQPTDQLNFLRTYDGLGDAPTFRVMGTIANIVRDSPLSSPVLGLRTLEPRVMELAGEVARRLDDAWWTAAVALLPAEMIPAELTIDPRHDLPDGTPLPPGLTRDMLFGGLAADLTHAQLVAARRRELRETFAWRRDHLHDALVRYLAWRRTDPTRKKLDEEIR